MICLEFLYFTINLDIVFSFNPNLSIFLPVDILLFVNASIFGFNLRPTFTGLLLFLAIEFIFIISLSDSALINNIFLSIAYLISSAVFPTPEKTIFFDGIPAFKAATSSPFETTSAPN